MEEGCGKWWCRDAGGERGVMGGDAGRGWRKGGGGDAGMLVVLMKGGEGEGDGVRGGVWGWDGMGGRNVIDLIS